MQKNLKPISLRKTLLAISFLTPLLLGLPQLSHAEPATTAAPQVVKKSGSIKESIVKIFTVTNEPNYYRPWNSKSHSYTGSGSIISGNRILTNAHVVANSTYIQVKRYGQTKRYEAKVLSVSHEADLAILEVADQSFFENALALELGELPEIQQSLIVFGFPTGGGTLSVTQGVVSRIEYQRYAHSSENLLSVQVDAAINSGNSGGPVISGGKIVGVVMQKRPGLDNVGYMVPTPIIKHFLDDIEDGKYDGFPDTGLFIQQLESQALREKYNVPDDVSGVLVYHVNYNAPTKGIIQKGDIITAIDGHDVSDTAKVEFRPKEYIDLSYYEALHQSGETAKLDILRDGKAMTVDVVLDKTPADYRLVPFEQYDKAPRYFIWGGLVFTQMTTDYLATVKWSAEEVYDWAEEDKQEVVLLSHTLADTVNKGYHNASDIVIAKVNGKKFKDFQTFYDIVTSSKDPFMVFEDNYGYQIVIKREEAEQSHEKLLKQYGVRADRSIDFMKTKAETSQADTETPAPKAVEVPPMIVDPVEEAPPVEVPVLPKENPTPADDDAKPHSQEPVSNPNPKEPEQPKPEISTKLDEGATKTEPQFPDSKKVDTTAPIVDKNGTKWPPEETPTVK